MNIIKASEINTASEAWKRFPRHGGWYRFWEKEEIVNLWAHGILPEIRAEDMKKRELFGETYYCVYMGTAKRESVAKKLSKHVEQLKAYCAAINGIIAAIMDTHAALGISRDRGEKQPLNDQEILSSIAIEYDASFTTKTRRTIRKLTAMEADEQPSLPMSLFCWDDSQCACGLPKSRLDAKIDAYFRETKKLLPRSFKIRI